MVESSGAVGRRRSAAAADIVWVGEGPESDGVVREELEGRLEVYASIEAVPDRRATGQRGPEIWVIDSTVPGTGDHLRRARRRAGAVVLLGDPDAISESRGQAELSADGGGIAEAEVRVVPVQTPPTALVTLIDALDALLASRREAKATAQALEVAWETIADRHAAVGELSRRVDFLDEQIDYLTHHDLQTGVANRTALVEALTYELERAERMGGYGFAVMGLEFGPMTRLDACLGLEEDLLRRLSGRLLGYLEEGTLVGRLSDSRFAVLLRGVDEEGAVREFAAQLWEAVSDPVQVEGKSFAVRGKCGAVIGEGNPGGACGLLRDMELTLMRAEDGESGTIEVFDSVRDRQILERIRLESEVLGDLEAGRFQLHFQPIVSLTDGGLAGFEALVRWNHAERGQLPAAEFIPVAEQQGLIGAIDEWVLRESCRQLVKWQTSYGEAAPFLSINISRCNLLDPEFAPAVVDIIREMGAPADLLRFEITETAMIRVDELADHNLEALTEAGVSLWVDDFGVGSSSMTSLQALPVDGIKLDRNFLSAPSPAHLGGSLIEAAVEMGRNLGLDVVAEGVETSGDLERVRPMDCRYVQGYFFSAGIDSVGAEQMMDEGVVSEDVGGRIS